MELNEEKTRGGQGDQPITAKELEAAIRNAASGSDAFTLLGMKPMREIRLKRPVKYRDVEYDKLEFDFGKITGQQINDIIDELMMTGIQIIVPRHSDKFLIRALARACTAKVGYDLFLSLWAPDYTACIATARLFF